MNVHVRYIINLVYSSEQVPKGNQVNIPEPLLFVFEMTVTLRDDSTRLLETGEEFSFLDNQITAPWNCFMQR